MDKQNKRSKVGILIQSINIKYKVKMKTNQWSKVNIKFTKWNIMKLTKFMNLYVQRI